MFNHIKDDRVKILKYYTLFCSVNSGLVLVTTGFTMRNLFTIDYQWMIIMSLPFLIAYNGKRGYRLKYFFYLFYPLHILLLYFITNSVNT